MTLFKKLALVVAGLFGMVSNASAALTATDVPMTGAIADITLVFLAVLSVLVTIFGFNKIKSQIR